MPLAVLNERISSLVNHPCWTLALAACCVLFGHATFIPTAASGADTNSHQVPEKTTVVDHLSEQGTTVYQSPDGRTVWLVPDEDVLAAGRLTLPCGDAPMRSMGWKSHPDRAIKFTPEPRQWIFTWKKSPPKTPVIEVVFDRPVTFGKTPAAAEPAGDGSVMLHAHQAQTHGEKLRFEPQWFKNTVGYWTVSTDFAQWDLVIDKPGTYSIAVLQGCGAGQGGSEATITLQQGDALKAELPFKVIETGHFQNFRWNPIGLITIDQAGTYQLRITPKRIAKAALCDVRNVHLVRQAKTPD